MLFWLNGHTIAHSYAPKSDEQKEKWGVQQVHMVWLVWCPDTGHKVYNRKQLNTQRKVESTLFCIYEPTDTRNRQVLLWLTVEKVITIPTSQRTQPILLSSTLSHRWLWHYRDSNSNMNVFLLHLLEELLSDSPGQHGVEVVWGSHIRIERWRHDKGGSFSPVFAPVVWSICSKTSCNWLSINNHAL